jgi:hypothetical protein
MVFAFASSAWTQGVIYVTPSHPIYYGSAPTTQNIDITGSGCTNFVLFCDGAGAVLLYPQGSNSMIVAPIPGGGALDAGFTLVAALNQGDVIGSNAPSPQLGNQWFDAAASPTPYSQIGDDVEIDNQIYTTSYFAGLTNAYIGFELVQGAVSYYGWMQVQNPFALVSYGIVSGEIVGWAYSTTPNTPIVAGAGLLAPLAPVQIVRPGNLRLNWQSQIGQAYQVQFKNQVDAPSWSNSDLTIVATATDTSADIPMTGAQGYYRVIQMP